ncbi:MAG: DNA alkylation repair protein [Phycisphaerae bacterium]|nr:DNA alkylation repair protein [Phycisphaerae bacterium]
MKRRADPRIARQMVERFGIDGPTAATAFGLRVGDLRSTARSLRSRGRTPADAQRNHALAEALWATGQYEARLMAAFIGEPSRLTVRQMDRWARGFDNWAVCDTACFCLFDRAPGDLAWGRVRAWAAARPEFVKRAGFAVLASLTLHDKTSGDAPFERCLPLIRRHACDGRNFVKKAVNWALRAIGKRNKTLRARAIALAEDLAASTDPAARWVARDALRELRRRAN